MSIKIEIIQPCGLNPPFLILNDKEVYPIIDIVFKGETDVEFPTFQTPFVLLSGKIYFIDIFNETHCIIDTNNDNKNQNYQESIWKNRVDNLNNFAQSIGKDPEKDESKLLPPWFWHDKPEDEWPRWMLN